MWAEGELTWAVGWDIGSCLHALRTLRQPRWEDFEYEREDKIKNRFHWLGDGSTENEKHMKGDRKSRLVWKMIGFETEWETTGAWYLNEDYLDIPAGS